MNAAKESSHNLNNHTRFAFTGVFGSKIFSVDIIRRNNYSNKNVEATVVSNAASKKWRANSANSDANATETLRRLGSQIA